MTELDITVNDGLRLSELYGQLAELNFRMENIGLYLHDERLHATLLIIALGIIIGLFLVGMALYGLDYWYSEEAVNSKKIVACIGVYILILAVIWCIYMDYIDTYAVYNLECDISRVQGEINGILARYGGASP